MKIVLSYKMDGGTPTGGAVVDELDGMLWASIPPGDSIAWDFGGIDLAGAESLSYVIKRASNNQYLVRVDGVNYIEGATLGPARVSLVAPETLTSFEIIALDKKLDLHAFSLIAYRDEKIDSLHAASFFLQALVDSGEMQFSAGTVDVTAGKSKISLDGSREVLNGTYLKIGDQVVRVEKVNDESVTLSDVVAADYSGEIFVIAQIGAWSEKFASPGIAFVEGPVTVKAGSRLYDSYTNTDPQLRRGRECQLHENQITAHIIARQDDERLAMETALSRMTFKPLSINNRPGSVQIEPMNDADGPFAELKITSNRESSPGTIEEYTTFGVTANVS